MAPTLVVVRADLPRGTVTFLFTDVEGSTRLLHELGAVGYAAALAEHRRIVRDAFARHGGVEVDTQGDAFFVAFPTAPGALAAAREMAEELASGPIRVRIGIHTGTPYVAEEGYVGPDVNRAARIAASGHGGQVLVSAATAALVGLDGLRDLGDHRLKDLSAAERIFQLGEGEFPRLETLHQTNLPVPSTPFLGRERELGEVMALVAAPGSRLLTLIGAGGSGKTRLALQAAAALANRYPDGVYWVPLVPLRDPALVLDSASRAVGADNGLAEHVADKQLLLLFDNFEHVLAAADELSDVLARCPALELLVTSREPLRLAAEQTYPVPPLAHPEAVGFFAARARAVQPDFEVDEAVSEICRRLDDLPLALELAAARMKALSTRQLLERLEKRLPLLTGGARDAPDRQRTLRATIEWSYELLQPEERQLLARLSLFRGGCTLEAAEAICDADLDVLQSLVEKSLVRFSNERYWMLETIREFAEEQLAESGEANAFAGRHAEHFLMLAEEAAPYLEGGDPTAWLARLDPEDDNVRASLDRLEAAGDTQLALQLVGALPNFWMLRGHVAEGRRRAEEALAADDRPTRPRARALFTAANMAALTGDTKLEQRRLEDALALSEELGDERGAALARFHLATTLVEARDYASARTLAEASVAEFQALGDAHETLAARRFLAWMCEELGDLARYRELTEQNLELARMQGDKRIEARSLGGLGMLAVAEGRLDDAAALLAGSFRIDRDLGFTIFVAVDLVRFAALHVARGAPSIAARLLARADALRDEFGFSLEAWAEEERRDTLAAVHAAFDEAEFERAWDEGRRLSLDEAIALAVAPPE